MVTKFVCYQICIEEIYLRGYKISLADIWKSGRVAECVCLENRSPFTGTVGSNPTSSDTSSQPLRRNLWKIFILPIKEKTMEAVLEQADIDLFYKLFVKLLLFVNKRTSTLAKDDFSHDEFMALPIEKKFKVHAALYDQKEFIDQFFQSEQATSLNKDELAIISGWKHFEKGQFFIYKHLKKHSIFINDSEPEKAYAVSGIFDSLDMMFPNPPVLVQTVLLPFKQRIIYDGLIRGCSIYFGSGFRRTLKDSYEKAKHNFGLITQLPINTENVKKNDDLEKLKFYMKNKSNRDYYWDEIVELSLKNQELTNVFYQEMGKTNARYFSKQLKRLGIEKKWFGILDNTVVASGASKDQLQKNIKDIVPKEKIERVYIFKT